MIYSKSYCSPREPSCRHDDNQPASACVTCKDDPRLQIWRDYWTQDRRMEWLRQNDPFTWARMQPCNPAGHDTQMGCERDMVPHDVKRASPERSRR